MNVFPTLAARFAALLIAILAVYRFGSEIPYMEGVPVTAYVIALVSILVFPLVVSLILWAAPSTMLGTKVDLAFENSSSITPRVVSRVAVSLLAIWVLSFGVIDLVYFETEIWAVKTTFPDDFRMTPQQIAGRATNIVQIMIGIGLWRQRYRIAKLALGKYDAE